MAIWQHNAGIEAEGRDISFFPVVGFLHLSPAITDAMSCPPPTTSEKFSDYVAYLALLVQPLGQLLITAPSNFFRRLFSPLHPHKDNAANCPDFIPDRPSTLECQKIWLEHNYAQPSYNDPYRFCPWDDEIT